MQTDNPEKSTDDDLIIEDDPELGKFIDNYPGNRLRLLVNGGIVLIIVWFVVTVALWRVEVGLASAITVGVLAVATLIVGWYISHLWNREVVLYERGFSYREGSVLAFIHFSDITAIRQQGERRSYFGGLIHRTIYRFTIHTIQDEKIVLHSLYRDLDELTLRLEQAVTHALRPTVERALAAGERVPFNETLFISSEGLHESGRILHWPDFAGHRIKNGQLILSSRSGEDWYVAGLETLDSIRLLIGLLRQHQPSSSNNNEAP